MNEKQILLRSIPQTDELLHSPQIESLPYSDEAVKRCVKDCLARYRSMILAGTVTKAYDVLQFREMIRSRLAAEERALIHPVINATGVILHTNLGRSPLAKTAIKAISETSSGYCNLEYDLNKGTRGSRYDHVESLLCQLTGAESAMAVNNNAAAVLLILSTLCNEREAVISRGELIEIGGSFRIPEIMESCGCILREVGTTNKTYLNDYENALSEKTGAILKVHTSNYRIVGFTCSPAQKELADLAHRHGLPFIEDNGCGILVDPSGVGLEGEPHIKTSLENGADLVCFSGDKLLGGPQAGLIVGKKEYIDRLKKHPLARALRIDKMAIAALEATFLLYANGSYMNEIPIYSMLTADNDSLRTRAANLAQQLTQSGINTEILSVEDRTGGGTAPDISLDGWAVQIVDGTRTANEIEEAMRLSDVPVIGRIICGHYCLSVRTIQPEEEDFVINALLEVFR